MPKAALRHRLATPEDLPALRALTEAAIAELQRPFLDAAQVAASRAIMRLGTQLMEPPPGDPARRRPLAGARRGVLDPARDAARALTMYTHPAFVRRGVGRTILAPCEAGRRR